MLVILPSRKLRQASTPAMPLTSTLNKLSMVNTRQPSSLRHQASTPLASRIQLLVLTLQINIITISSSSSKPTVQIKPIKLELFLNPPALIHLTSPATTAGAVTTGLRIAPSHGELYLRKTSSFLSSEFC